MQDCEIFASFADDTLLNENDYDKAISQLEYYGFPINYDKSGKKYHRIVEFVGCVLTLHDVHHLLSENGVLGGAFSQRYHWERKIMISSLPSEQQVIAAYCLERLYGHEFYRGECMSNIEDGGYLSCIPEISGCTRAKYACDTHPEIKTVVWRYDFLPSDLDFKTRKNIHFSRKNRWKSNKRLERRDLKVIIEEDEGGYYPCDRTAKYPKWAELTCLQENLTSGSLVGDLSRHEVELAIVNYSRSQDPISSFISKEIRLNEYPTAMADEDKEMLISAVSSRRIHRRLARRRFPDSDSPPFNFLDEKDRKSVV